LDAAFTHAFAAAGTDLQSFLAQCNPAWTLVGGFTLGRGNSSII
jgi:hypothetical protein